MLHPDLKADLYDIANKSDGLKLNIKCIKSDSKLQLTHPLLYIFEEFIKIIANRKDGSQATLRVSFKDNMLMTIDGQGGDTVRLEFKDDSRIAAFTGVDSSQAILLTFDDSVSLDKAVLGIQVFAGI